MAGCGGERQEARAEISLFIGNLPAKRAPAVATANAALARANPRPARPADILRAMSAASDQPPPRGRAPWWRWAWFGVLPTVDLALALLLADGPGGSLVRTALFPTPTIRALAIAAVAANLLVHSPWLRASRRWRLRGSLLGLAAAGAAFYALNLLPLLTGIVAMIFLGIGLLAAGPYFALAAVTLAWGELRATAEGRGWAWCAVATALAAGAGFVLATLPCLPPPAAASAPDTLAIAMSGSREAARRAREALRRNDPGLLWNAAIYPVHGFPDSSAPRDDETFLRFGWFLRDRRRSNLLTPHSLSDAQLCYYRVHGRLWSETPAPSGTTSEVVARLIPQPPDPLADVNPVTLRSATLTGSTLALDIDSAAAVARLDWDLTVRAPTSSDAELRLCLCTPLDSAIGDLAVADAGAWRAATFAADDGAPSHWLSGRSRSAARAALREFAPGRFGLAIATPRPPATDVRVRLTLHIPLDLEPTGQRLRLPVVAASNFAIPERMLHDVVVTTAGQREEQRVATADLLDAVWPIAATPQTVACAHDGGTLVQEITAATPLPRARLALVVEASRSAKGAGEAALALLDAWPAAECALFAPGAEETTTIRGRTDDPALREALTRLECAGGIDPAPALVDALAWLGGDATGTLVWLHGDQAMNLAGIVDLPARCAASPAAKFAVAVRPGWHLRRNELVAARAVEEWPRLGALADDLRRLARGERTARRTWRRDSARTAADTATFLPIWGARRARELARQGDLDAARALTTASRVAVAGVAAIVASKP